MPTRAYALLIGIVLGLIGCGAFVPGVSHPPPADAPALLVPDAYGFILGIFPINIVESLFYLGFASYGVAAWNRLVSAVSFARACAVCFALLAVMGLIDGASTAFGLLPLFGADVALHAGIASSAAVYGFVLPDARLVRV